MSDVTQIALDDFAIHKGQRFATVITKPARSATHHRRATDQADDHRDGAARAHCVRRAAAGNRHVRQRLRMAPGAHSHALNGPAAPNDRPLRYNYVMTTARSSQVPAIDAADVAWERRRRAAWIDYLRAVREADRSSYDDAEGNAWEQLQRRLRRNDELRITAPDARV